MRDTQIIVLIIITTVILGAIGAAPVAATNHSTSGEAAVGTAVDFQTSGNAVANYSVDQQVIVERIQVAGTQSNDGTSGGIGIQIGLNMMTSIPGANISSTTTAGTSTQMETDQGATITANDNARGVLQIQADSQDQMATINVSDEASARQVANKRIVVDTADGETAIVIMRGSGNVTVNDAGHVSAQIEAGSQVVYRQYGDTRSKADKHGERMIANGSAAAEVYVNAGSNASMEESANVVQYADDTHVEVTTRSADRVELTADRDASEGRVILTSVDTESFQSVDDLEVMVDGEAATRADSMSAVGMSVREGDEPRYYASQSGNAGAIIDVAVGLDGFSLRSITMTDSTDDSSDDTTTDDGGDADGSSDSSPGFGAGVVAVALGLVTLVVTRRQ